MWRVSHIGLFSSLARGDMKIAEGALDTFGIALLSEAIYTEAMENGNRC